MRKIGFASCRNGTKEIIPKTYRVEAMCERRRMFFSMFNELLPQSMQMPLTRRALFEKDIRTLLHEKIMAHFPIHRLRPERTQCITHIYAPESLLFLQYFKQCTTPRERYLARDWEFERHFHVLLGYTHPAAQVISQIFDGREVALMCDLDTLFAQTVYRRMPRQKGATITFDAPYIHIDEGGRRTRLYPRWKQVDTAQLHQRRPHLEEGFKQLRHEAIDALYLVYPKSERFMRHVTISQSEEMQIKMIPYSFTFTNRKEKTCKK